MSDNYQAVYDAVRSRISGCNIQEAVERALDFSHAVEMVRISAQSFFDGLDRPSIMFRPNLSLDGNQWIALYGDNLQEGVVGVGDSPDNAMRDFDRAWYAKSQPSAAITSLKPGEQA